MHCIEFTFYAVLAMTVPFYLYLLLLAMRFTALLSKGESFLVTAWQIISGNVRFLLNVSTQLWLIC